MEGQVKDTVSHTTGTDDVNITVDDSVKKDDALKVQIDDSQLLDNKGTGGKDADKTDDQEKKDEIKQSEEDEKKDVEKPLIDEKDTVAIDLGGDDEKLPGEDTPTLPLPDKKKPLPPEEEDKDKKEKPPSMFLHPVDTLRYAWKNSKSVPEFFVRALCIVFGSLGWLLCVGGVPLLPLVMLIIGSIFINDCPIQPKIPVYLVVAGLFGLIQHAVALVSKYIPKEKRGGVLEAQRKKCLCLDTLLQTFLFVWFIAGCAWVYSIYEPEYEVTDSPDYCHKTVYLFTFWMFNISFIIFCSIIVVALCVIICVVTQSTSPTEKTEE